MIGLQKKQLEKFEFERISILVENENVIRILFTNNNNEIAFPLTQKNEKREFKTVESALNFIKLFEREKQEIRIVDLREN